MTKKGWLTLAVSSQAVMLALSVFGGGKKSQLQGPYHNFLAASTAEAADCGYCEIYWPGTQPWRCAEAANADTECFIEDNGSSCDEVTTQACC